MTGDLHSVVGWNAPGITAGPTHRPVDGHNINKRPIGARSKGTPTNAPTRSSSDPGRPGCHQLLSIAMLHGAAGRRSRASGGAGDGCHSRTRCNVHRLSGLVGRGPARHDSSLTGRCLVRCTLPCWGEGSEMGTNVNAARVIYESFAAGDIGAFLAALDDR